MYRTILQYVMSFILFIKVDTSRILCVFPTPSKSHQIGFRPFIHELVKRGHDVTIITAEPEFVKENAPINLTEVNIHDVSYNYYEAFNIKKIKVKSAFEMSSFMFEKQLLSDEVQILLQQKKQFDLLLIEMCVRPGLVFSHIFKVPVILISSFGGYLDIFDRAGAATHPFLYPSSLWRKINNLSLWDKLIELYVEYNHRKNYEDLEIWEDQMLQRVVGTDVPPLRELKKNVVLYFFSTHRIWDANRPVPPNVIYLGGLHLKDRREIPKDLREHLDSSVGVIYTSFGTNVDPSTLPPGKIKILSRFLSQLPYTVLWKWNKEKLPGHSKNIVTSKWFPQADLLHHPKMKLFITQGGLQSTEEAIDAGIPLLGIPLIGDQWYNVEIYEHFKIGLKVDFEAMTEDSLREAIDKLINDSSYRQNILQLRQLIRDQPQSALKRAVWWTEYALRHANLNHLHTPIVNISLAKYYELYLILSGSNSGSKADKESSGLAERLVCGQVDRAEGEEETFTLARELQALRREYVGAQQRLALAQDKIRSLEMTIAEKNSRQSSEDTQCDAKGEELARCLQKELVRARLHAAEREAVERELTAHSENNRARERK
ncbi:unnamed protein product [Colias eurytheme]|nr:unnamed protein product [Colias eurytheme]